MICIGWAMNRTWSCGTMRATRPSADEEDEAETMNGAAISKASRNEPAAKRATVSAKSPTGGSAPGREEAVALDRGAQQQMVEIGEEDQHHAEHAVERAGQRARCCSASGLNMVAADSPIWSETIMPAVSSAATRMRASVPMKTPTSTSPHDEDARAAPGSPAAAAAPAPAPASAAPP